MDKPLSDIKKDNDGKADEAKSAQPATSVAASDSDNSKPGHHDFIAEGSSKSILGSEIAVPKSDTPEYNPELSYKNWEEDKKNQRLDSTALGRGLIRLESRGVLGASAFVLGGWYVTKGKGMSGYNPEIALRDINPTKPLQYAAKFIDTFAGKPIKFTAKMLGASEETAEGLVRFRPSKYTTATNKGRSLGQEGVAITFDFFSASVADAIGRDLANLADHHVKHDWKNENGDINYGKATKAFGKTLWRYLSYNGGEDWAAAVPYAYYMKAQRKVLNHFNPGFELDFDRGLNGGSFKVNQQAKVTGNYLGTGLIDLQGRFTAYNDLTLMYREGYNYVSDKLDGKDVVLYGEAGDKNNQKHGVIHDIGNLMKWGARSTVKSVIYMTPAVPFFSVFRTSQSKTKGMFINPENEGVLGYKKASTVGDRHEALHADELNPLYQDPPGNLTINNLPAVKFRQMDKTTGMFTTVGGPVNPHPLSDRNFDAFKLGEGSRVLNKIGQGQVAVRNAVNTIPRGLFGSTHPTPRSMDNYINAAFAYTPYMYAKGETARLWDDGKMDASSERMIDGAASLNFKEFKAGAGEVWRSILHKPLKEEAREAYAQQRIEHDSSPPDNLTEDQARIEAISDQQESPLYWRNRIIHAPPAEKAKPEKQSSHAEQEAMRKALHDLQPPTSSVH